MKQRLNYPHLSPDAIKKLYELSGVIKQSGLEQTILDLVNLRASQINGCAFCVDMHVKEAKIHGERELRLHHVTIWRESALFSDKERAALEWTEAVTKISEHGTNDQLFDRVRTHLSEKELSDITVAIGMINMWNRLAISFQSVPGSADQAFGLTKAGLT